MPSAIAVVLDQEHVSSITESKLALPSTPVSCRDLLHCAAKRKPMMSLVKGLKIRGLLICDGERASCEGQCQNDSGSHASNFH